MAIRCLDEAHGDGFAAYHGDCCDVLAQLPDTSVGLSVFSPPFSNLFVYSDSEADIGNATSDDEFLTHYEFVARELLRVTKPGRHAVVHCSDLPLTKWRDGVIGINPLSDMLCAVHRNAGWILHSRVTVWKCPVVEMTRTKALGLLHKQLLKDSSMSRVGMADYLLVFRAPGINEHPVNHRPADFPVERWQQWASPVWMDIRQTNTLNAAQGRENADERHVCPLQLDLIERAVIIWSNRGDTLLSPFMGIGSEGVVSLRQKRRFIGVELKRSYFDVAAKHLMAAEAGAVDLFDVA